MVVGKPPYSVPSIDEIRAVPSNGFTMVSTFSGCGGSCTGFRNAGFEIPYAVEFIEAARDSYAANFPTTHIDSRDVREISPTEILEHLEIERGDLDLLEGSPPCASFSTSGVGDRAWGTVKTYSDGAQRTDDLFFEYARILDGLRPRVFVAENVSGLVRGRAKGYYKQIHRALADCGYRVEARLLDAAWLGVPQARRRLIFVGVRDDLVDEHGDPIVPAFPRPLSYQYTIRDAVPSILDIHVRYRPGGAEARPRSRDVEAPSPTISASGYGTGFVDQTVVRIAKREQYSHQRAHLPTDEPISTILANEQRFYVETPSDLVEPVTTDPETGENIALGATALGLAWDELDRVGQYSARYHNLVRADPNRPSPTITAAGGVIGAAGVTVGYDRRKFTLAELRALSSFPPDFVLTGNYRQRWERIGRSVPPMMAYAIARTIRDEILERVPR